MGYASEVEDGDGTTDVGSVTVGVSTTSVIVDSAVGLGFGESSVSGPGVGDPVDVWVPVKSAGVCEDACSTSSTRSGRDSILVLTG